MSPVEYACRWSIAVAYQQWAFTHGVRPIGYQDYCVALGVMDAAWLSPAG